MTARPNFKLSRLREIGWARWDPIGLRGTAGQPDDEYDSYLLQAAGRLWNGASQQDIADYLVNIETEHMGLSDATGVYERARDVALALDGYVAELRA